MSRRPRALVLSPLASRREALRRGLRAAGFEVWESWTSSAAGSALRQEGAMDVAVLDATADGVLALARELRAERAFDRLRLLLLMSELRVDEILRALDSGVDDYLPWPFSAATLADKLAGLGLKRRSRSASSGSKASRG